MPDKAKAIHGKPKVSNVYGETIGGFLWRKCPYQRRNNYVPRENGTTHKRKIANTDGFGTPALS